MSDTTLISDADAADLFKMEIWHVTKFLDANGAKRFSVGESVFYKKSDVESIFIAHVHALKHDLEMVKQARKEPGYIYILSNESFPDYIKIGRSKHGARERSRQLNTAAPSPFKVEFELFTPGASYIELKVHEELDQFRVKSRAEFFDVAIPYAVDVIINQWRGLFVRMSNRDWHEETTGEHAPKSDTEINAEIISICEKRNVRTK